MAQEFSRIQRVGGQIQRELAQIIQQELRDPRLGLVTVSAVEVSKDMAHAKVFITLMNDLSPAGVMNPEQAAGETLKVLKNASGFLRRALGKRIVLRIVPELHFVYDSSLDQGARISALLNKVAAEHPKGHKRKEESEE